MKPKRESVILIPVPSADSIVGKWRNKYDEVSLHGIPAHITILFPFKSPEDNNLEVIEKLRIFFSRVKSFSFSLGKISSFPNVIFLEPAPKTKFVELTKGITKIFPENPPYEDKFPKINPHLTIGQLKRFQNLEKIKTEIYEDIRSKLPIKSEAIKARLMESDNGRWTVKETFPFI